MPSSEHVGERAAEICSLEDGHPERLRAEAHALSCPECARALRQGARLLALIGAAHRPSLTEDQVTQAFERLQGALGGEGAPAAELGRPSGAAAGRGAAAGSVRRWSPRTLSAVLVGASGGIWVISVVAARHVSDGALRWMAALAGLALALALLAGRARPRHGLTLASLASLAISALDGRFGPSFWTIGLVCAAKELTAAAVALGVGAYAGSRDVSSLVTLSAGAALLIHSALAVSCPAPPSVTHSAVFHTGALLAAALVGLLGARRYQARAAAR